MAYVILCKAARKVEASTVGFQVSNVSESVLPLQIKRSSFLDIAINLDCHTAITWSERAKPGLRWSLCHLSDITHLRAPEGNPDHVRLAIDGSGRGGFAVLKAKAFRLGKTLKSLRHGAKRRVSPRRLMPTHMHESCVNTAGP